MDDGKTTGEALLDALPTTRTTVGSFACRLNRSVEWCDDAFPAATGLDADSVLERDFADAVIDADRVVLEAAFHEAVFAPADPEAAAISVRVRIAESGRTVDLTFVAQRDPRGVVGINALVDDVSAIADA